METSTIWNVNGQDKARNGKQGRTQGGAQAPTQLQIQWDCPLQVPWVKKKILKLLCGKIPKISCYQSFFHRMYEIKGGYTHTYNPVSSLDRVSSNIYLCNIFGCQYRNTCD